MTSGAHTSHMTRARKGTLPRATNPISINRSNLTAMVEPGLTMEGLVNWTLQYGMIPLVVPEFKEITVGGAVAGAALESTSFTHGQFSDTCERYLLRLGDGSDAWVNREDHADLFHGIVGSYGTIARLRAVELHVRPAKKYVSVKYQHASSFAEAIEALKDPKGADYLDAVAFAPDKIVISRGYETNEWADRWISCHRWWDEWTVQRLKDVSDYGIKHGQYTLSDYLFRFDRGAFWMGQFTTNLHAASLYLRNKDLESEGLCRKLHGIYKKSRPSINPSFLFRLLAGWKLSSTSLYKTLHQIPADRFAETFFVHDFYLPTNNAAQALQQFDDLLGIYPLWLCPMRGGVAPQPFSPHYGGGDFINIGAYGLPREMDRILPLTREAEQLVRTLGGRKMLYSVNTYPEEEFWEIYPKEKFQALRELAKRPATDPDLYTVTHPLHFGSLV